MGSLGFTNTEEPEKTFEDVDSEAAVEGSLLAVEEMAEEPNNDVVVNCFANELCLCSRVEDELVTVGSILFSSGTKFLFDFGNKLLVFVLASMAGCETGAGGLLVFNSVFKIPRNDVSSSFLNSLAFEANWLNPLSATVKDELLPNESGNADFSTLAALG